MYESLRLSTLAVLAAAALAQQPRPEPPQAPQQSQRSRPTQQTPEQQVPKTKPEDLASVEGRVVNALTGEPLNKASLTLRRIETSRGGAGPQDRSGPPTPGGPPRSFSASTDATGRFTMRGIEPGNSALLKPQQLRWGRVSRHCSLHFVRKAKCDRHRPEDDATWCHCRKSA